MKNIWMKFWPYIVVLALWGVAAALVAECDHSLKKENEQLREELARQQQYVPLQRDTIRDTVAVVTQKVVEVDRIKNVLTKEDRQLLKDLKVKVSALESYQTMSTVTEAEVPLTPEPDSKSEDGKDSVLAYHDAWLDLKFNSGILAIVLQDSLAIAVEKEYKKKFLWWRWGTKGYRVKVVNFCPYSTVKYNTFVKRRLN